MSLLRKSLISLCLASTTCGSIAAFTTAPAQAKETKATQCQRFQKSAVELAQYYLNAPQFFSSGDPISQVDAYLAGSETALKQFQVKQFSDPKIKRFQQTLLNYGVSGHNNLIKIANAMETRNSQQLKQASDAITANIESPSMKQLRRDLKAYCGAHIKM